MGEPAKPTLVIAGDAAGTLSGRLARLRLSGEQYACEACPDYDEAGRRLEALAASGVPVGACFATPGGADGQQARFLDTAAAGHPLAPRVLVAEKGAGRLHRVLNDGHRLDRFVPLDCTDADLELALDSILARHRSLARLSAETRGRIGRHLFITGATGFLGLRLVRDLLLCTDARLTLFVRNAARLAIDVHDFPGRVEVLEGDMAAPDLGLPGPARAALAESVDEIWHLAAVTAFNENRRDEIMGVNVDGTRALLSLASEFPNLACFNHISTAYVAGTRVYPEVIAESPVDSLAGFKNPYEESKHLAERLVTDSGLPCLIYRPSIIFGETFSGRSDGKTVYGVAKVCHVAKALADRHHGYAGGEQPYTFRVLGSEPAYLNLIPVDWTVDALLRLRAKAGRTGRIFHIAHPEPVTIGDLYKVMASIMDVQHHELVTELDPGGLSYAERILFRKLSVFKDYMTLSDPVFDVANTHETLDGFRPPRLTHDLMRFLIRSYLDSQRPASAG